MYFTETASLEQILEIAFKLAETSNNQWVKQLSLSFLTELFTSSSHSTQKQQYFIQMNDDQIEKFAKHNAVREVMTGKYLKQLLSIKKVTIEEKGCEESIKLLIVIKRLIPLSEEIDEIISKLKSYRINEIVEALNLKVVQELGKKPWYMP